MPQFLGGARIRNKRASELSGTLGCVVYSAARPGERFILSAGHVLGLNGYAQHGDAIEAFSEVEQAWKKIAEFEASVPFRGDENALQACDAAIARITANDLVGDEVEGIGIPKWISTALYVDKKLQLRGARSKLLDGATICSFGDVVPVRCRNLTGDDAFTLRFGNQILYGFQTGGTWRAATLAGDSGALIFDSDGLAVGMHIAIPQSDYPLAVSVCTPIKTVLDLLGVSLTPSDTSIAASPSPVAGASGVSPPVPAPVPQPAPAQPATSSAPAQPAQALTQTADTSPARDPDQIGILSSQLFDVSFRSLLEPHNSFGGVRWQLTRTGLIVDGRLDRTPGTLVTVPRVWSMYGALIAAAASRYRIPMELIISTICTESSGLADAIRFEPRYVDDVRTPDQISVGLMQTLISSAREAIGDPALDRQRLLDPGASIDAGAACIARKRIATRLDPPLVACVYNAGHLELQDGPANRWKIRQYPIGTGAHADRFVQWFNDCFAFFAEQPPPALSVVPSFFGLFGGRAA